MILKLYLALSLTKIAELVVWALVKALGKSQLKSGKTSVLKSRYRGWAVAQAEWRSGVCCGAGGVVGG